MLSEVTVKEVLEQPLAVVRFRTTKAELGQNIRKALGESLVYKAIGPNFGFNTFLYACEANHFDVQIGVQMDEPFTETEEVTRSSTPAGRAVHVRWTGSYDGLGQAYQAISAWCEANGESKTPWFWEVYGHWNEDTNLLEADVYYLLRSCPAT